MRRNPSSSGSGGLPRRRPPERPSGRPDGDRLYWMLGLAALGLGIVYLLRSVFAILFAAAVFAYLLDPVVDRLEERGYKREHGIGVVFGVLGLGLVLLVLVVVPLVAREIQQLAGNLGGYIDEVRAGLIELHHFAEQQLGRPVPIEPSVILHEMQTALTATDGGVGEAVRKAAPSVGSWLATALTATLSGGFSVVVSILNLSLLPIFTFYLLRDWDHLIAGVDDMVPNSARARVRRLAGEIDERLGSFVRGQTTICAVLGVLYSVGLLISGIDLAIVVGLGSGALFIVPYLGTVVGVVLASVLALLKFGLDWHLIAVWLTFGGAQLIEGMALTPTIMGDKVGLHPLVVMIALLVGGNLFGIWGMLFAIPATAAAEVLIREWLKGYRDSRFFSEGQS